MRLISAASATLLCLSTAAFAFSNSGPSDTYTGLRGSILFDGEIGGHAATTPVTNAKADTNAGGGASIFWGWKLPDGFRTELELLYGNQSFSTATVNGTSGKLGGYTSIFAPMINAYWDLPVGDIGVKPFIGGGIGYGWGETGVKNIGGTAFPTVRNDAWNLTYSAMAGISIPTSESSRVTGAYRWLHQDIGIDCGASLSCKGGYNSSSINLGFEIDL